MKKLVGVAGVALTLALVFASPSVARADFSCNGVFNSASFDDVVVPRGGACTLVDSAVEGDVKVRKDGYLQTTDTTVRGDIRGAGAQTIFVDTGTRVSGSIQGFEASQVFVYNATVNRDIDVEGAGDVVQICGTTVLKGDIVVQRGRRDILIGDPLAVGCAGNTLRLGDLAIRRSAADVEFVIRGNRIRKGNLEITRNTGDVRKFVEDNIGGARLICRDNSRPFAVSDNIRWDRKLGQCGLAASRARSRTRT
jgi:hypothetical protein